MHRLAYALMAAAAIGAVAGASHAGAAPAPSGGLVLLGDGVSAGGRTARIEVATAAQAIALVGAVLGKPTERGSHGDCGQGAVIGYAKFRGDFELSFVRGKLSGWTADGPAPKTSKGIGVNATLATLRKAYPDIETDGGDEANGGLGPSFGRDGGPNGWLDGTKAGSKVIGLFAGATCLSGV